MMSGPNDMAGFFPHVSADRLEESGHAITRAHLVNRLNWLHFSGGNLLLELKHKRYGKKVTVRAIPMPCEGEDLACAWFDREVASLRMDHFELERILFPDGRRVYVIQPTVTKWDEVGCEVRLPETCREVEARRVRRYTCQDVRVKVIQNSAVFTGEVLDFTPLSFRVRVGAAPPQTVHWLNADSPLMVIFESAGRAVYAGDCRMLRQDSGQHSRTMVLEPLHDRVRRYPPKRYRSGRYKLTPSPNAVFVHPLTGSTLSLKVADLSGTGLSVEESEANAVLLPSLIIPELDLRFAGSFSITCSAQVVYRNAGAGNARVGRARCGLVILDMDMRDHSRLLSLLHQVSDQNSYLCGTVDLDALWGFFFESGFLYPEKYGNLQASLEQSRATYEKLYSSNPSIARHFTYEEDGAIQAHMAMLRYGLSTWLVHHYAASRKASARAGLVILDHLGRFIDESCNLYSAHMAHIMCFFRPDNRTPNRLFGGLAEFVGNPKGCSLDRFAYWRYTRRPDLSRDLPEGWHLEETTAEDLVELQFHYATVSGGLLLSALDLDDIRYRGEELSLEYMRMGFSRERHVFSLKKFEVLKAVLVVTRSDAGLNLSELTSGIMVLVVDSEDTPAGVLEQVQSFLSSRFHGREISMMMHPVSYADRWGIGYERVYDLFVFNTVDSRIRDTYFDYLKKWIRSIDK